MQATTKASTRVKRFTHRNTTVNALMYDGTNEAEIKAFFKRVPHREFLKARKKNPIIVFSTLGAMEMEVGDYAIQTDSKEQYVVDKKDFDTYYEFGSNSKHLPWEMLKKRYINKVNRLDKDSLEFKVARHILDEIRELEETYK